MPEIEKPIRSSITTFYVPYRLLLWITVYLHGWSYNSTRPAPGLGAAGSGRQRARYTRQSQSRCRCRAWRPHFDTRFDVAEQVRGRTYSDKEEIEDTMFIFIVFPPGSRGYGPYTDDLWLWPRYHRLRSPRCSHFLVLVRCNVMRLCNANRSDIAQ